MGEKKQQKSHRRGPWVLRVGGKKGDTKRTVEEV